MKKTTTISGLMLLCLFCLVGCSSSGKPVGATKEPEAGVSYEPGVDFVGAVKAVTADSGTIEFYNTSFETMESYQYSGGTQILTKNDKEQSASEIIPGEVYDVYTSEDGKRIVKMKKSADVTLYENAPLTVNAEEKRMTIRDVNYAYTPNLLVFSRESRLIQERSQRRMRLLFMEQRDMPSR